MNILDGKQTVSEDSFTLASALARKAALSKARYPLDYTFTRVIKTYTLI